MLARFGDGRCSIGAGARPFAEHEAGKLSIRDVALSSMLAG